jgi:hypothetical protein
MLVTLVLLVAVAPVDQVVLTMAVGLILDIISPGGSWARVHRGVVGTNRLHINLETLLLLCYPLVGAVVQALAAMELLVILAAAAIQELHQVLQI